MKKTILLFLLTPIFVCAQTQKIQIHITQTEDYCGGAAPAPQLLEQLKTPQNIINKKLYIVKGTINKKNIKILKIIKSNNNGICELLLPKGTYAVLDEFQIKKLIIPAKDKFNSWDKDCLKKYWETPLQIIVVKNKVILININIHKYCSFSLPCNIYNGPLPP